MRCRHCCCQAGENFGIWVWDADFEQFVSVVKLEELPAKGKVELRRRLHTVAVPRNFHLLVVEVRRTTRSYTTAQTIAMHKATVVLCRF